MVPLGVRRVHRGGPRHQLGLQGCWLGTLQLIFQLREEVLISREELVNGKRFGVGLRVPIGVSDERRKDPKPLVLVFWSEWLDLRVRHPLGELSGVDLQLSPPNGHP